MPTRLPWTRLRCWELTSLLPTLPVIGTKAAEQVSQPPPRRARPGPTHVSEMSAAPLVSQAWPFPRRSAPRKAPYWQRPDSGADGMQQEVALDALS